MIRHRVLVAVVMASVHAGGQARAVAVDAPALRAPAASLVVPNVFADAIGCAMTVPRFQAACTAEGCAVPYRSGATVQNLPLRLSCAPSQSPTGFENPPDYVKVQYIRGRHAIGNLSFIEDIETPASGRMIEVTFCIYGKSSNLFGFVRIPKKPARSYAAKVGAIKDFLRDLTLRDAPPVPAASAP